MPLSSPNQGLLHPTKRSSNTVAAKSRTISCPTGSDSGPSHSPSRGPAKCSSASFVSHFGKVMFATLIETVEFAQMRLAVWLSRGRGPLAK